MMVRLMNARRSLMVGLPSSGDNEIKYTSAREYASDAVEDIADAIRALKSSPVSSTNGVCQKCRTPTNGEEAWVDGQIWCHPCADKAPVSSYNPASGGK